MNYRENNNTNFNLELLVKIGENNQILSKEDIGLISMIIMNKKFMNNMKNEIKLGKTVDSIAESFNLNIYQEHALIQLSKEMKNQNKNYKYSEK